MSTRGLALVLAMSAACATAGPSQPGGNNGPSPDARGPDAAGHGDAAPSPDGSVVPDAAVTPDAPANACAYSGVLASWSLSGQPGTEASTAATSSATGVTAGALQRAATLTATSGTGSMNSSGWPTSAQLDATKYYTISITPPTGCSMSITSVSLDMKASSTGPASAAVATSVDAFAQTTTAAPNATSTPALSVSGQIGAVEIRIFGYAATGTTGTMRVQNTLSVTGSMQ